MEALMLLYFQVFVIFVSNTTNISVENKICHVEKFQISKRERCREIGRFSKRGAISNVST